MIHGDAEKTAFTPSPYIVAEMASAHMGEVERARAITAAAVEAGAHAIKYQIWSRDAGTTPDHEDYEALGELEFCRTEWLDIMAFAAAQGIDVAVDVDDLESLAVALEGGVDILKIRVSNIACHELLESVAKTARPVLLATGASTTEEISVALEILLHNGAQDLVLMHGFQAFPTQPADTHLRALRFLATHYSHPVGYADHADSNSPLASLIPVAALAAGARVIEKHITIDREKETHDFESALNGPEFKLLVQQLEQVRTALGTDEHPMTAAENAYRDRFRKSVVAAVDIGAGETITALHIGFKRSGVPGTAPDEAPGILGKAAIADIPVNSPIHLKMVR